MLEDLLSGAWQSVVYGVVGVALMVAGFVLVDLLTPGRLRELIWVRRNANAGLLLAANQLGVAGIVFTAILTSYSDFAKGIASTLVFGGVGLLIMALAFFVLDLLTPASSARSSAPTSRIRRPGSAPPPTSAPR